MLREHTVITVRNTFERQASITEEFVVILCRSKMTVGNAALEMGYLNTIGTTKPQNGRDQVVLLNIQSNLDMMIILDSRVNSAFKESVLQEPVAVAS